MTLNIVKYQNTIIYICHKLGGELRGKKKLAKLLYFADFDMYEKNQKSITGDSYRALAMGPVPISLEKIISTLIKTEKISVNRIEEHSGYIPTEVYGCLDKPDISIFTDIERSMLDRIVTRYGQLNGKQLELLSHDEAPYVGTKLKDIIPYELAFYRGTDYIDL